MHRPAPVAHPVLDAIRDRWSPRAFADRPVTDDELLSLLEAARWAPSSSNEQPWTYLLARRGTEGFRSLLDCLKEGNVRWAERAPVLMMSFAHGAFRKSGRTNRFAFHDVGLANMSMALQAASMGMAIHMMAGYFADRVRQRYELPDQVEPVAAMAVGHRGGDPDALPDELPERERQPRRRRPLDAFVFQDEWGSGPAFLAA